jgi:hypothetical protein
MGFSSENWSQKESGTACRQFVKTANKLCRFWATLAYVFGVQRFWANWHAKKIELFAA